MSLKTIRKKEEQVISAKSTLWSQKFHSDVDLLFVFSDEKNEDKFGIKKRKVFIGKIL